MLDVKANTYWGEGVKNVLIWVAQSGRGQFARNFFVF